MATRWSKADRERNRQNRFPKSDAYFGRNYLFDYYNVAFAWINQKLPAELSGVAPARRRYWDLVPPGKYDRARGRELVLQYATSVENQLAAELRQHSLAYWVHVYRRTSPYSIGRNETPATIALVRQTLEAAFQKYGRIDAVDDLGWSDRVDEDQVLTGVPKEFRGMQAIRAALSGKRRQMLLDFGVSELTQLYECERLAYELWQCGSSLRWLSKGSELQIDPHTEHLFFDLASAELTKLVGNFDSRDHRAIASATGAVYGPGESGHVALSVIAQYNVTHRPASEVASLFPGIELKMPDGAVFNFNWIQEDFGSFLQSHLFLHHAFLKKHGFSFQTTVLILYILTRSEVSAWQSHWEFIFRSFQRAYVVLDGSGDLKQLLVGSLTDAAAELGCDVPTETELRLAVDSLTLDEKKRSGISLLTGGPKFTRLPVGPAEFILDYAWISETLHYLFFGVALHDENIKGKLLEKFIKSNHSLLPDSECRGVDGESREADGAFGIGDILVLAECKANARSIGFDRGDPDAIAFRNRKLEEGLTQVDEKAAWFGFHPVGTNYDISRFRVILPVVVTPYVEYIPSTSSRYWLTDDLPRVMTPHEFESLLADQRLPDIVAQNHSSVYLPRLINPRP